MCGISPVDDHGTPRPPNGAAYLQVDEGDTGLAAFFLVFVAGKYAIFQVHSLFRGSAMATKHRNGRGYS